MHRYKSSYDQYSGVTTLTILNLCPEDEGEYTCTAINALGETSTTAALVAPTPSKCTHTLTADMPMIVNLPFSAHGDVV